ncbi:MAG: polysaccharide deacetylase family protein [Sulfuricella sp.]
MTAVPQPRRWKPSPLINGSLALHACAVVGAILQPEFWPWAVAAIAADQGLLTAAGMWPRSSLLGPNWTCLPGPVSRRDIAITIDDGPDPEVTPRVLDILDAHGAQASFFCIGARAERYPELCREIVTRGHAVENHSQNHLHHFSLLGPRGIERELQAAQDVLAGITGEWPRFFRPTAGLRSPLLEPVLSRLGLHLASWTRRGFDTRDPDPDSVAAKLLHGLGGGDILLLHDGNAARPAGGDAVILKVLPILLQTAQAAGLHCVTLRSALP